MNDLKWDHGWEIHFQIKADDKDAALDVAYEIARELALHQNILEVDFEDTYCEQIEE